MDGPYKAANNAAKKIKELEETIRNPFDKVYWFARMFINSDQYGGIGSNSELMLRLASLINRNLDNLKKNPDKIQVIKKVVFNLLIESKRKGSQIRERVEKLCHDLDEMIEDWKDSMILSLTLRHIIVPTNRMIEHIPSSDTEFGESVAKAYLNAEGEKALRDVIEIWDELGKKGCLTVERTEIVDGLGILRHAIKNKLNEQSMDYVVTAFVQEFERRAGQKRKGRAGRSLEDVTGLILSHFNITKQTLVPIHLRASLEIDKLVEGSDGWYIGISCKRTFRERWKQSFTTDFDMLDRYKIKEIWHVLTYDRDLSDEKIAEIGGHRCRIYLPDQSSRFFSAINNPEISKYVRPLSKFVSDLKKETS